MVGGIPMPVILEWNYADGSTEAERIPAEIWRKHDQVTKVFAKDKQVSSITMDPYLETADIDTGNNHWPSKAVPSRFDLFKQGRGDRENPMQRAKRASEMSK